jgi:hypothetical protein
MKKRPAMQFDDAPSAVTESATRSRPGNPARPPLLILNGLGANIELVAPFVEAMAAPTIVTFDVPGGGLAHGFALPALVGGALAEGLLDHLDISDSDVLGVSGRSDRAAVRLPVRARCRRLVLAATAPGALMVPAHPSVLLKMVTPRRYVDTARTGSPVTFYGGVFRRDPNRRRHAAPRSLLESRRLLPAACGRRRLDEPALALHAAPAHADHGRAPTIRWSRQSTPTSCSGSAPDARLEILDCGHLFLVTAPRNGRSSNRSRRSPRS